jgi:uncharacterized caspase-like protein
MLRIWVLLMAVCGYALCGQSAIAETRVALVVGNGAYVNAPPLPNPMNDARAMAAALKGAGFEVVEALDADKAQFEVALRSFAEKLSNADVALFFYAGHGLQVGAQNFLVPIDAKLEHERDLEFEAVKLDFVQRQMEIDREGKTTIVMLDACRDNPLARNLARSMGTRSVGIGRGLAASAAGLGTFIAYATQPGNVALDGGGQNSPFTSALVKHLGTKGRNLQATMIEVRKDVVAATNGKQVPWDHSALTGDFYFVPGEATPVAGPVVAALPSSGADVTALQERLRKLEDQAQTRASSKAANTVSAADVIKLADLRVRAAGLAELVADLQRKVLDARTKEGQSANADEKSRFKRDALNIQTEWSRRGLDLQTLKDEIAQIEGTAAPSGATVVAALPVIPEAVAQKVSPNFDVVENVALVGAEIRSFRAPNPVACREACEQDALCKGFQHGRKNPVMGTCLLFSRIDARQQDSSWFSGLRTSSQ